MEDMVMEPRKYKEGCWSQLPQDLVVIIANRLNTIKDFLSFSSVCSSWRTAVPKEQWNPSSSIPCLPWLLLSKYHPWLLLSKYYDRFSESVAKVLVSLRPQSESDNNTNDNEIVVVVVMYSFGSVRLRFARPGFKKWATLQDGFDYERRRYFYDDRNIYLGDRYLGDVVCYKGRVFAVCSNETFVVCEFDRPSPKAIAISPSPPLKYGDVYAYYLVESGGDLLLVIQYDNRDTIERAIEVYKFNGADNEGGGVWTKLEDLGGCTLFRINCFDMKDNTTEHYSFTNLSPVWVPPIFGLHCVMPSSS
ncbi:hypothetical protein LguiA_026813 [Lonicera macranthoides]